MGTKKLVRKMNRNNTKESKMSPSATKAFINIASNLALVGRCHCGKGSLFSYLADTEHPFNAYCLECGSITDIRFPKNGDTYKTEKQAPTPLDIIKILYNNNTEFKITDELAKTLPIDSDVNSI